MMFELTAEQADTARIAADVVAGSHDAHTGQSFVPPLARESWDALREFGLAELAGAATDDDGLRTLLATVEAVTAAGANSVCADFAALVAAWVWALPDQSLPEQLTDPATPTCLVFPGERLALGASLKPAVAYLDGQRLMLREPATDRMDQAVDEPASGVVRIDSVELEADAGDQEIVLSDDGRLPGALIEMCLLVRAASLNGVSDVLLRATVDFAKARDQFGRPIGSFQAVSHRLVDGHLLLERSRSALLAAILAAPADRRLLAVMARRAADDAQRWINTAALQLHGAIGFTMELPLGLWLHQGQVLSACHGHASWCRLELVRLWKQAP
jgi:alkylation response protein AidB-like acyl-CoA dehydrogenase